MPKVYWKLVCKLIVQPLARTKSRSLCAIKLPEETQRQLVPEGETSEEGWRGLDGRRCEHALHAVANAAELLAKRSSPISSLGTFTQVMEVNVGPFR